jgi:hypothetical protein
VTRCLTGYRLEAAGSLCYPFDALSLASGQDIGLRSVERRSRIGLTVTSRLKLHRYRARAPARARLLIIAGPNCVPDKREHEHAANRARFLIRNSRARGRRRRREGLSGLILAGVRTSIW